MLRELKSQIVPSVETRSFEEQERRNMQERTSCADGLITRTRNSANKFSWKPQWLLGVAARKAESHTPQPDQGTQGLSCKHHGAPAEVVTQTPQ